MIYELRMPDLTTNDSPVRIVRWIAQPGDVVQRGQPLLEAETDKATMDVESAVTGRLERVLCEAAEDVSVGQVIAVFEVADSVPATGGTIAASAATVDPPVHSSPAAAPVTGSTPPASPGGKGVGMFARKRAAASEEPMPVAIYPLSIAQRTTARRMQSSKQSIPHYYLQTSFNAGAIVMHRQAALPLKLAWDAFFVRAAARALRRYDRFGCRLEGEQLVPANCDAIGVAVDVDHDLFVVPIAAPAENAVEQISEEIRRAVALLRDGDAESRRMRPVLMTVTNLGSCNVESFVPIINPPEVAILGVGAVQRVPVVQQDGQVVAQHRCTLTLCVDHRVASGKYAAEFLSAIVEELEKT